MLGPAVTGGLQVVERLPRRPGKAACERSPALEDVAQRREAHPRQLYLDGPAADAELRLVVRVVFQPVRIRALHAVHAPRVLWPRPVEELRRAPAPGALQVGDLQCMQVWVLGEGDLGLPAETNPCSATPWLELAWAAMTMPPASRIMR